MRVLVGGAFNLLHPGHLYFLEEAKKYGDELIVVIATDETVSRKKGFRPVFSAEERKVLVEGLKPVDRAVIGFDEEEFVKIVEIERPDVIVLGKDQEISKKQLEEQLEERGLKPKVIRLDAELKKYSTEWLMEEIRELQKSE